MCVSRVLQNRQSGLNADWQIRELTLMFTVDLRACGFCGYKHLVYECKRSPDIEHERWDCYCIVYVYGSHSIGLFEIRDPLPRSSPLFDTKISIYG